MLVSDVGMFLVSDLGYCLVCVVCEVGIWVSLVLGVCVVIVVLSVVGLFSDCFIFEGFLLVKGVGCCEWLNGLVGEICMLVFYEFLYCIIELLVDMVVVFGVE